MAANNFNINNFNLNNNNAGLLPPVGAPAAAPPVVPPLPLGNMAAAVPVAALLYPIPEGIALNKVKDYVTSQQDIADGANLDDLASAYLVLLAILNNEPISEAQKQNLLQNLDEIRSDLEDKIKNIFFDIVIDFNPGEVNFIISDLLGLYKALNKLDGRPEGHIFAGDARDDEPQLDAPGRGRLGTVAHLLVHDFLGMLDDDDLKFEVRENAEELVPVIEEAQARIRVSKYPTDPALSFLIEYLGGAEAVLMDEGFSQQDIRELRENCLLVQDFRRAAAFREAEAGNINANNENFLRRVAINAPVEAAARRPELPLKTVEEAKAILEAPGNGEGGPKDMGPEARGRIEQRLIDCFYENYKELEGNPAATQKEFLDFIRNLLIRHEAVIAGGFILKTIAKTDVLDKFGGYVRDHDMDVYIPCRKLKTFNIAWAKLLKAKEINQFAASLYCVSFLRKNGIRSVQKLYGSELADDSSCTIKNVDIMAVRNKRKVLDVVQNFDLTFCQVWYDGRGVFATHPTHIQNRVGYLQKDYVPLFVMGNRFLRTRMLKYTNRGFKILLDPKSGGAFEDYVSKTDPIKAARGETQISNRPDPVVHDEAFYKRWAAHSLLEFFLNRTANSDWHSNSVKAKATNIQLVGDWTSGKPLDLEEATFLHPTDGYDSEDCDIDHKETFYPAINEGLGRGTFDDFAGLKTLPDEDKWLHLVFYFYEAMYSPFPEHNLYKLNLGYNRDERYMRGEERQDYRVPRNLQHFFTKVFNPFLDILQPHITTLQEDPITLDEAQTYHIHDHESDKATSADSLMAYLDTGKMIEIPNKTNLKCYVDTCTHPLTMSEIHAIVPFEYYQEFAKRQIPKPDHVLLENSIIQHVSDNPNDPHIKAGITNIFQNVPTTTDGWGELYHIVMCPFCLEYMRRDAGCLYVYHEEQGRQITPYCRPINMVDEIFQKYKTAATRLRAETDLLVCGECGRPCAGHKHFSATDPVRTIPSPNYTTCTGGGRREMVARILAVRKVMRENPGLEPIELRRKAAFAADAVPNDADLLAKADSILALEATKRHRDQMNQVLDGNAPIPHGPPAPPVPEAAVPGNAENEAPLGAVGNVFNAENNPLAGFAPNIFAGGRRQIGKPHKCSHGYTNSYKEKIPNTRKDRHGGSRMTRKKIE